jgi:hypothetical protein
MAIRCCASLLALTCRQKANKITPVGLIVLMNNLVADSIVLFTGGELKDNAIGCASRRGTK